MIKTTINKSDVTLEVRGGFSNISAEYILLGKLICDAFKEKDKKLAEMFESGIKQMAEDHVFSCSEEELEEKMAEAEEEDPMEELVKSLEDLKKTLSEMKK